ncbi:uncharacterized protein TRUGW13939_12009 [Talaromyces rugulosus]|uniref:NACHT domain-containing protein n=1 Tax=Talaromyces rugulosus TaxID=121627 RepID=A0A7H8RJK3_TALRU|nr:uncharacterized protein TRUGW13939_12009 [Talaromyces rugulosus]QKX64833.1 hypothetical protein TRUGW13939_12009 [Talaromyces rugulosus]
MGVSNKYTIGWICAVKTECVAAKAFLDKEHENKEYGAANDSNVYTLGEIGKHNVVIAQLPKGEYGIAAAASVARDMARTFPNIRFGLMVGIGGGAPSKKHDIRLGDVVVSAPHNGKGGLFQYDFGKTMQDQKFRTTGFLDQPPSLLRAAMSDIDAEYEMEGHQLEEAVRNVLEKWPKLRKKYKRPDPTSDRLYQTHIIHPSEEMSCEAICGDDESKLIVRPERSDEDDNPAIHYGLIASANQQMKNAMIRDRLAAEKDVLCFEMEAAGLMNHFPCLVIRGICDYSDSHKNKEWQGYAAMAAAAYAKDLLSRVLPNKVEAEKKISDVLTSVQVDIEETRDNTRVLVSEQRREKLIAKLPFAKGSTFDSSDENVNPRCLLGTRTDLQRQIQEWAQDQQGKCIFWLNGMAGTGKSTISRTVAESFMKEGKLGASFFFKRSEADRSHMNMLFTTISAQLLVKIPALAPYIETAINTDPYVSSKSIGEQFEKLIIQPLSEIRRHSQQVSKLVVVIDALDECAQDGDSLLRLLSQTRNKWSPSLQIFITSRPELVIRLGFREMPRDAIEDFILHEISHPVIENDIAIFLKHEFAKIQENHIKDGQQQLPSGWPGSEVISTLVQISVPLFIFAATICHFVGDTAWSDPVRQLNKVLVGDPEWLDRARSLEEAFTYQSMNNVPPMNKRDTIYFPWEFEDVGSDEGLDDESVASDASSAVFSEAPSQASNSSRGSVYHTATSVMADIFVEDAELISLYNAALPKLSPERFMRNHNRLLKKYFIDLGTEIRNDQQRRSVRFLRQSEQRKQITEEIFNHLTNSMKGLNKEPDRKLILERFLQTQESSSIVIDGSNDAGSGSDTSSADSDEVHNLDDSEGNYLSAIVDFLTKGVSFDRFKENLRHFINPPNSIQEALSSNDPKLVKDLLSRNLDHLVEDEYPWLRELIEIGCSLEEIAELLLEKHNDAPWIYFEPHEVPGNDVVVPGLHLDECVHDGGRKLNVTPALIGSVPQSHMHSSVSEPMEGEAVKLRVQQLCGLAGVAPNSRNLKKWNGSVLFEDQNSTAYITYDLNEDETDTQTLPLLSRVCNALQGFCKAVGQVQEARLCCDCFTILRKAVAIADQVVEMCRVEAELAVRLLRELKRLQSLNKMSLRDLLNCESIALEILGSLCGNSWLKERNRQGTADDIFHLCSLAVQFLCFGYYSYCQAHNAFIQPFFLDTPLRKIVLLGSQKYVEGLSTITVELVDLTCMGDMLQGPVVVFSANNHAYQVPCDSRCDLLASPEDLMDTWGPGNFLINSLTEYKEPEIYAISIGGGFIVAVNEESTRFHWSRDTEPLPPFMKPFHLHAKISIGATIVVNENCNGDESQRWLNSNEFLENLGTFAHLWESTQRQGGIQSGQYVNIQFNQTWNKIPGKNLKQIQLSFPDDHLLPFLQSPWGLQMSFCTGVGRRIPLRELIADVMPAFVESLFPIPQQWERLKVDYKIIDAFRSYSLQTWLCQLPRDCQELVARIVRYILSVLQFTGIDRKGEYLVVAWIQRHKPFQCFRIPCEKESYWARILMDSEDCATFAYVTSNCLETDTLRCRGPAAIWQNTSALLETAVSPHKKKDDQLLRGTMPWSLKHMELYSIGNIDSALLAKVDRPSENDYPRLFVSWSITPISILFRLKNKWKQLQRLRERQAIDARAEGVVVVAKINNSSSFEHNKSD